jgi:phosphatidylglycerophosphate synthase
MPELEGSLKRVSPVKTWVLANFTIPNLVTLVGFYLTFKLIYLRWIGNADIYTFCYFLGAAATDFVDGFLAKHYHWVTALGGIIDKIRDKVLIVSTFLFMRGTYKAPAYSTAWWIQKELDLIICIEIILFIVAGLIALARGKVRANKFGEYKMGFECATVIYWAIAFDLHCFVGFRIYDIHVLQLMLFLSTASLFLATTSTYYQIKDNYKLIPQVAATIRRYYDWH